MTVKKPIRFEEYKDTELGMIVFGRVGIPVYLIFRVYLATLVVSAVGLALLGVAGVVGVEWMWFPAGMVILACSAAILYFITLFVWWIVEEIQEASKAARE